MRAPGPSSPGKDWRLSYRRILTEPAGLEQRLGLPGIVDESARADFPLRVPQEWLERIRPGDPADPLLRQVLPDPLEMIAVDGDADDPVGDRQAMPLPGLLHKYRGRVLLVASGSCAIHCRYCFRRRFPYGAGQLSEARLRQALDYIRRDESIDEVILSGGDPLSLGDEKFADLVEALAAVPRLQRLRIHTRLPVAIPSRIGEALTGILARCRLQKVVVLHANHPAEIDAAVAGACRALAGTGATLLNQAVLLRGVNDDVGVLEELSRVLFGAGVLPYYLHQLDRVRGAAHFEVSDAEARELVEKLRRRLPGYLVPRLVREEKGAPAKTPL